MGRVLLGESLIAEDAERDDRGGDRPVRRVKLAQLAGGQAAVVGIPATSMLSLTAKGTPQSGSPEYAPSDRAAASAASRASWMKIPGSATASSRRNASRTTSSGRRPAA